MNWLSQTEKTFRTSKCAEADKVEYATNLLRGAAHFWWELTTNSLGPELARMLTLDQFKVKFCEEFCSDTSVRQLEEDFMHLEQRSRTVQEYTVGFIEKARCAQHQVNTEARKIDRYLWGLKTEIREIVKATRCTTFRQAVEAAKDRETELKRQSKEKERISERSQLVSKRPWEGKSDASHKRSKSTGTPYRSETKKDGEIWCNRCRKHHDGPCSSSEQGPNCFLCGKPGHRARDCKDKAPTCFNCGEIGHIRPNCPKPKTDNQRGGTV